MRHCEGRGFMRIWETLGEDLQGERIHEDLGDWVRI